MALLRSFTSSPARALMVLGAGRLPMGLPRVRWAMLLAALGAGTVVCGAALARGTGAGVAGAAAVLGWMVLLVVCYRQRRLLGWSGDAVEGLLLAVVSASVGLEQSLGVFYTSLFFRAVHGRRGQLVSGVVLYMTALVSGCVLSNGLSSQELALLPMQAMGLPLAAFPLSIVLGSLLARTRELAEERQLLEAVLDSLDVAVLASDPEGRPAAVNAAARAAGLSAELLLTGAGAGRRVVGAGGSNALPLDALPLRRAQAGMHVRDQEIGVETPDRQDRRDYLINARPVQADPDAPVLVVAALHDVTERRRAAERLERQALHDALTGLPNRLLLRDRIEHALHAADRRAAAPALLFLDLDGFKAVNDSAGHDSGDQVLIAVAERLRSCLRAEDTLARLGGDEFAVLLEETGIDEALALARRLIDVSGTPVVAGDNTFTVGASVGVTAPGLAELRAGLVTSGDLLRNADLAMYEAKNAGGGRVQVYADQMHEALLARVTLQRDLRDALDHGQLRLHYQPVVSLGTGRTVGVEALLRWQSPRRGLVPPGDFIPLAEATGLIVPIGAWVLHQACQQAASWRRTGRPELADLHVAVNVSVHQLHSTDLVQTVRAALEDSRLPADQLVLEITESAFGDTDTTLPQLHALRALGVQLAIDDFGTGYSSLTRLQTFPVDTVKIDRSFVTTIQTGQPAPLVTATLALAEAFGLSTVAEGVENQTQEQFLRQQGCQVVQGFRYSRPVTATELADHLTQQNPTRIPTPRSDVVALRG